ncbi:hypothetical protein HOY80DRAFT_323375 [Tuber brumale]|nr:hypothetical protein HOY80DRAFT_323375 [Tuber brumale]
MGLGVGGGWLNCSEVSSRFHKGPHFSSGSRNFSIRLTPLSLINHRQYQYSEQQNQEMAQPFSNNISSFNTAVNTWNNCTIADDRSQILTWLSPLHPRLRHQNIQDRRVENIGEWLLKTGEFRSWYTGGAGGGSGGAVLFCYGDPGVGKTYIR